MFCYIGDLQRGMRSLFARSRKESGMNNAHVFEAEASRATADRWELFEDIVVGADLLIDVSATTTGLVRFISSGEVKEAVAGFGYLAMFGMGLLIAYFILRILGEEPCKRRSKYLTYILSTPIKLHKKVGGRSDLTFYPDSEEGRPEEQS